MTKTNEQVIIIGAGIAGLTAAWHLKQQGIQALILEANQTVGGRMKSIEIDDAIIDCGAQFLSSAYSIIPELIKETGLNDEFFTTSEWVGIIKHNHAALIRPRRPWTLISSRLLSFWNCLRLGYKQFKLFHSKKKSLNDITDWIEYDNQSARDWVIQNFNEIIAKNLTSPILNGFYFQSLSDSSAAMIAVVLAFSAWSPKTMTLKSGMNSLPLKLAEKLNIKINVNVSSVIETSFGVKIMTDAGEFNAEQVIITTPAPIAKNILQNSDKETSVLLETQYSSSILIALLIRSDWSPPENIFHAYGFLVNPESNSKIAALTIENNKCASRKKSGYLINIMLADKWAKNCFQLTDAEIFGEIQPELEKIFPDISVHTYKKEMFRWQYAMPYTPIGRAKDVNSYRMTRNSNHRVWLAGDYLGLPWTDSAAQTGLWAAQQVQIRSLRNNNC
jgi:oxygen-dependent protoporphyrinogen oxidase